MEDLYKYLKDVQTINPNVGVALAIEGASDDTEDATAVAADIREGKTAYIATGKVTGTFKGVDTSDANATEGDLLSGKIAYVNGNKVIGTIVSKEAQTYTPSSSEQVINAGQYLAGAQTITAVPTEEKSITPSSSTQEVAPATGKFLSKVTVGGDANLVADNIKNGVSIFGVQGTLTSLDTSDADATEGQILSGKTAYVNGEKVTGILSFGTTLSRQGSLSVSDSNVVTATTTLDSNFCIYSDDSTPRQARLTLTASQVAESIGLTADKLVTGNTILGITGTTTAGVDTSDATATAEDIASGETAYVNGEKITGTVTVIDNNTDTELYDNVRTTYGDGIAATINGNPLLLRTGSSVVINGDEVKTAIGLTADKIKAGETILGVEGIYSSTSTAIHSGKVIDTANITLQVDYVTNIMKNNFEIDGYTLAEGDVIMFPDNSWVSAVVTSADVAICNHSSSDTYNLAGKQVYVMSKAEIIG